MSPELSIGDVGEADVGARISPGFAVEGVENCTRQDKAPSTRIPLTLSGGAADGVEKQLFSPFLQGVRVMYESLVVVLWWLPRTLLWAIPFEVGSVGS